MDTGKSVNIWKILRYGGLLLTTGVADLLRPVLRLPSEPIEIRPDELRIWWIGHATVLINLYGTVILTDPVLVNWLPWPRRIVTSAYTAEELPQLDYVVISHAHHDHLNRPTLRRLASKTKTIVVPRQCSDLIRTMGFREVIELDWQQQHTGPGMTVSSYEPIHWGLRYPWDRRNRGFNCYVFEKNGRTVFFGGDTAYGRYFTAIGQRHDIDVAILPIGAYDPPAFQRHHMTPTQAVRAFTDLKANVMIPIHHATFRLSLEPLEEPEQLLRQAAEHLGLIDRIKILQQGESFTF